MGKSLVIILLFFASVGSSQVLNEICPSNTKVHEDFFVGYLDWIELYNPTDEAISLAGFSLSNERDEPGKWLFPSWFLPSDGYITIMASKTPDFDQTINFSFPRKGGAVYLFSPENEIIDSIIHPPLQPNHSYGKIGTKHYYFDEPTPNIHNSEETGYKGYATVPLVNLRSGTYLEGTEVIMTPVNPEETVYYTVNGTNPELDDLYTSPIALEKTMSIRVVAAADSMLNSSSAYRSYFVNVQHDLPVINISADSLELFDFNTGIYMLGPDAAETPPHAGANFWEDQEVRVYYEYFGENFHLQDALDCHIEIFGGIGSRWRALKSIQLRAKNTYEPSAFSLQYFEEKELDEFKRLVLRNGGNDFCNSCMKDAALHKYFIESGLNVDFLGYNPVVVYINGHYIGIQNMREKADRYYIKSNYDLDPDEVNLLGQATLDVIDGDAAGFVELRDYAVNNNLNDEAHYNWVDAHLDINSFVDYFIVQLFVNNRDWPNFNLKVWNAEGHEKWRYICYDMDVGLKYHGDDPDEFTSLAYILDNFSETNPHVQILKALFDNEEFRRYFVNRYCDLLNTTFQKSEMMESILEQKDNVAPEMEQHYQKWCGPIEEWHSRFGGLEGFLNTREEYVHTELASVFDLAMATSVGLNVYPANSATIELNTIEITDFPFSGEYFTENAIDLTAHVAEGETFLFWENLRTNERFYDTYIQISPENKDHFVVVCEGLDYFEFHAFPNPVSEELSVTFSMSETSWGEMSIIDFQGKLKAVKIYEEEFTKGSHTVSLDLSFLPAGHYILFLTTSYGREATEILKL